MASITKFVIVLLMLLPCIFAASKCRLTVSQMLLDSTSSSKYNTYTGRITNVGSDAASGSTVQLSTSANLQSINGLIESGSGKYILAMADDIEVGSAYSFTFTVKKSSSVKWTASCKVATSPVTVAPSKSTTPAPAKTTKAPATTTRAPTTRAPSTRAPTTTKATTTTTKAPAVVTTKAPTATLAPSTGTGSSGKTCQNAGTWWKPAPSTTWQWQLTGSIDSSLNVQMYDIDLFDATPSLISALHLAGKTVVCYFSTQYENWRPDAGQFASAALGNNLDDWAGEKWTDIRHSSIREVMKGRLDLAVSKGCDGVEPDNVDGYTASTGFPLTAANQLDYNKFLANEAHARGLSVGLKNDGDQAAALQPYFDWALNEQCNQYSECSAFNVFINAGKAVFNCEYSGSATTVCPKMNTAKFSTLFKSLDLGSAIKTSCCASAPGGCAAKAAFSCVSSSSSRSDEIEADPALSL